MSKNFAKRQRDRQNPPGTMLTTLRIKNLALVSDLTLELEPGYNVITGETGAGKSILIGALKLVLGDRADRTLIRSDSDQCLVEAVFNVRSIRQKVGCFLEENGIDACENDELILKRNFSPAGMNRQFINGSPASLTLLAALGEWLVDFHGPHDHQSLLHPAKQLAILDAFGDLGRLRDKFVQILIAREALEAKKSVLVVDEKSYAQQLELLRFQAQEIAAARLRPEEEQEVEAEYRRSSNASKLAELAQTALGLLSESDDCLFTRAGALGRTLQELQRLDPAGASLFTFHQVAVQSLQDLHGELSHYSDKLEVDPNRLREVEERVNLIHSLKRKYGATIADIIRFGQEAQQKFEALEHRDEELQRLNAEILKVSAELRRAGQELSSARKKVIPKLTKAVDKQLSELGFKRSNFEIAFSTKQESGPSNQEPDAAMNKLKNRISSAGFDTVEFLFTPNSGEVLRPLRAIASSGEMARVMLALKTVLAAEDEVPVLIFDEVDANVGGETANTVGEKMLEIAKQRQVLCITHLPTVAACASSHFVVNKQVKNNRTVSEIKPLQGYERIAEIARMLGGHSEASVQHARALLEAHDQLG